MAALKEKGIAPKLGIIRCGENPSDLSYERGATKRAEEVGVEVEKFVLPEDVSKEELIAKIDQVMQRGTDAGEQTGQRLRDSERRNGRAAAALLAEKRKKQ